MGRRPKRGIRGLCLALLFAGALTLAPPEAWAYDAAARPGWNERGGETYYLNERGVPLTGWQDIEGSRYFFDREGRMASGWRAIRGLTYYFDDTGRLYTGMRYVEQGEDVFLFDEQGVLQREGAVTLQGQEYDLGINGAVLGFATDSTPLAAAVLDEVGWDLREAFDWSASIPYKNREYRAPAGTDHADWYAGYGFTNEYGNCYVMAATFYQMARLLGYDVTFIEGGVGDYRGRIVDHSWTEIVIDGELFVFDPNFTNETGIDGYQVWYGKKKTWWYCKRDENGEMAPVPGQA